MWLVWVENVEMRCRDEDSSKSEFEALQKHLWKTSPCPSTLWWFRRSLLCEFPKTIVDSMKTSLDPFFKPVKTNKRHLNPHKDPVTDPFNLCILGVSFYMLVAIQKAPCQKQLGNPLLPPRRSTDSSPALLVDFLFGHVSDALEGGMWIAPKLLLGLHHHFVFIDDMKFNKHKNTYEMLVQQVPYFLIEVPNFWQNSNQICQEHT